MDSIKVIGFDADDTLWENGVHFKEMENRCCQLMASYVTANEMSRLLYLIEQRNLEWYGYGVMAFTLSLIEASVEASAGRVPASVIQAILNLGREVLGRPVQLLSGVEQVLPRLQPRYRLIVVTKGDLLDQERKLSASGLLPFFHHIEVVTEKHVSNYSRLLERLDIRPQEFLMVGNSLRSDIVPVLVLGAKAVHIPQPEVWAHENAAIPKQPYFTLRTMDDLPGLLNSASAFSASCGGVSE
jgi:putative hydrolase of the HAD superfamily